MKEDDYMSRKRVDYTCWEGFHVGLLGDEDDCLEGAAYATVQVNISFKE